MTVINVTFSDFRYPASTFSVFRPGSTSFAAILYDAWEHFTRRSPKADEHIRSIRPELASAVDDCIDAAGREWGPYWQRRLLNVRTHQVVAFKLILGVAGRQIWSIILRPVQSYRLCDDGTESQGPQCRPILSGRNPSNIYPVSPALPFAVESIKFSPFGCRYTHTSPTHLISRLTARSLHLLALRISTYLDLKPDVVLKHWACAKISRSRASGGSGGASAGAAGDDEVCELIVQKFDKLGHGDVSYADIAKRAWEVGRTGLATKVISLRALQSSSEKRRACGTATQSRTSTCGSSSSASGHEGRSACINKSRR